MPVFPAIWFGTSFGAGYASKRARTHKPESAVSDDVVNRFIVGVAETLEVQTGSTTNPDDCTDAKAVAIRNLAPVYCGAFITGGTSGDITFSSWKLSVKESQATMIRVSQQFLPDEVKRFIE